MELRTLGACLVAAAALYVPRPASAAPSESTAAQAQALFNGAIAKMKAHDYATACPELEEVTRLLPDAIGAKVELAVCYEQTKRLASAWATWSEVQTTAHRAGQTERETKASERIRELTTKLSHLTLDVAPEIAGVPGLSISRDGVQVGPAQWGKAIPVDGGNHEVRVTAPGYLPFRRSVNIRASNDETLLTIPALQPGTAGGESSGPPADDAATPSTRAWQKPVGIGATALGAAGVVVGAILGGLALSKNARSNDDENKCISGTSQCGTQAGVALRADAVSLATGSTIAFVAGGVLAAGGVVLWMTAPKKQESNAGASTYVRVTSQSVTLGGTFW